MNSTFESSPVYLHQYQKQSQTKDKVIISYPVGLVNDFYCDDIHSDHVDGNCVNEVTSCRLELDNIQESDDKNLPSSLSIARQVVECNGVDCLEISEGDCSINLIKLPTNLNIVQVAPNVLVDTDSLIVCLPPEGMTIQLQSAAELSELGVASTDGVIDVENENENKLEKAQSWHRDSQLAVRALLALNCLNEVTPVSQSK